MSKGYRNVRIKALILTVGAFLLFLSMGTRVNAQYLYVLDNIIQDGDFPSNTHGWTANNATITLSNASQTLKSTQNTTPGSTAAGVYNGYIFADGHIYYLRYYFKPFRTHSAKIYFTGSVVDTGVICNADEWNAVSIRQTATQSGLKALVLYDNGGSLTGQYTGAVVYYDNVILIDLTESFGSGFEPSLSDFELLYLPDLDYFETYSTLDPLTYTQFDTNDYSNMGEDLTSINYSQSVIDNYGDNVDIDVYAYVYDTGPIGVVYNTAYYIENNHPTLKYNDQEYVLSWEYVDYSEYVIHLVMSDVQKEILKRILFDRFIDPDTQYFAFDVQSTGASYVKLWFSLTNTFRLNVDIESVLISRDVQTDNAFNIENIMYFKFYDKYGDILLPALKMIVGDVFETRLIDNFGSQYTDISQFAIEMELTSPDEDDPYTVEHHFLYELGIFSSSDIVFIAPGSPEIDQLWDSQVCNWYDLVCQSKNAINSLFTDIYNALHIGEIINAFNSVIASIEVAIDILPDGIKAIVFSMLAVVGTVIAIKFVERL